MTIDLAQDIIAIFLCNHFKSIASEHDRTYLEDICIVVED